MVRSPDALPASAQQSHVRTVRCDRFPDLTDKSPPCARRANKRACADDWETQEAPDLEIVGAAAASDAAGKGDTPKALSARSKVVVVSMGKKALEFGLEINDGRYATLANGWRRRAFLAEPRCRDSSPR